MHGPVCVQQQQQPQASLHHFWLKWREQHTTHPNQLLVLILLLLLPLPHTATCAAAVTAGGTRAAPPSLNLEVGPNESSCVLPTVTCSRHRQLHVQQQQQQQ
jgi:hypothetical protein